MRKKYINNNNIMLIIIVGILFSFFTFGGMTFVHADEASDYEKSFITIEIQEGTTLSSIAEEYALSAADYGDYITEVKKINNLREDTIHAGCYLLIPVYDIHH